MFLVDGEAYECSKQKIAVTTWENFWGSPRKLRNESYVSVGEDECLFMVASRKCDGHVMNCNQGECVSENEPIEDYSYFKEISTTFYHCKVKKILIRHKYLDRSIFEENKECLPASLSCEINEKRIIWDKSIVHSCEYSLIKITNFNITNRIASSAESNLLFQLKKTSYDEKCKMNITETTEGLFITEDKRAINLSRAENDINEENMLSLSDIDYKINWIFSIILELNQLYSENNCRLAKLVVSNFQSSYGKNIIISDEILFNDNGLLKTSNCTNISFINIEPEVSSCFIDIPISFEFEGRFRTGFLTNDGIIKDKSIAKSCDEEVNIILPDNKQKVSMKKRLIKEEDIINKQYINLHKTDMSKQINFYHATELLKNIDVLKDLKETSIDMRKKVFDNEQNNYEKTDTLSEGLIHLKGIFLTTIYIIIACSISLLLIIGVQ